MTVAGHRPVERHGGRTGQRRVGAQIHRVLEHQDIATDCGRVDRRRAGRIRGKTAQRLQCTDASVERCRVGTVDGKGLGAGVSVGVDRGTEREIRDTVLLERRVHVQRHCTGDVDQCFRGGMSIGCNPDRLQHFVDIDRFGVYTAIDGNRPIAGYAIDTVLERGKGIVLKNQTRRIARGRCRTDGC